jgi:hypothetical protein
VHIIDQNGMSSESLGSSPHGAPHVDLMKTPIHDVGGHDE